MSGSTPQRATRFEPDSAGQQKRSASAVFDSPLEAVAVQWLQFNDADPVKLRQVVDAVKSRQAPDSMTVSTGAAAGFLAEVTALIALHNRGSIQRPKQHTRSLHERPAF